MFQFLLNKAAYRIILQSPLNMIYEDLITRVLLVKFSIYRNNQFLKCSVLVDIDSDDCSSDGSLDMLTTRNDYPVEELDSPANLASPVDILPSDALPVSTLYS